MPLSIILRTGYRLQGRWHTSLTFWRWHLSFPEYALSTISITFLHYIFEINTAVSRDKSAIVPNAQFPGIRTAFTRINTLLFHRSNVFIRINSELYLVEWHIVYFPEYTPWILYSHVKTPMFKGEFLTWSHVNLARREEWVGAWRFRQCHVTFSSL